MSNGADPGRVLLIDDDELSREILELLLVEAGWEIVASGSGEEAVAGLRAGVVPQVILADLKMPGLSGAELATALRGAWMEAPPVLLAMSASEPASGATEGYDGFLLKPFSVEQFAEAVQIAEGDGLSIAAAAETTVEPATAEVLNEAKLLQLRASFKPAQMDELFRFALTDAERQLETMQQARDAGDDELYRRCAHSMKGSFGMLGAPELWEMATAAERDGCSGVTQGVTFFELFLGALERLRHTLLTRGVCQP